MARSHLDRTLTSLAGEFLVAGQICLQGWLASLTLKNYPGVDIFVFDPANERPAPVQVKASREKLYHLSETIDRVTTPYVFVHFPDNSQARFFVMPAAEVARRSAEEREAYLAFRPHVKRQQPRMISLTSLEPYENKWENLWVASNPNSPERG